MPSNEIVPETASVLMRRSPGRSSRAPASAGDEQRGRYCCSGDDRDACAGHDGSFRGCSVVDSETRLGVEEVERAGVDGDLDVLARRGRASAAPKRPTSVAVLLSAAWSTARSSPTSWASSRTSSVIACCASIEKCTMISEPSASRQLDVPRRRRSAGVSGGERGVLEVLGPDAEDDLRAVVGGEAPDALRASSASIASDCVADRRGEAAVAPLERRLDHVHRRAADEAADEEVDGAVVERLRVGDLLELALAHDGDAVAHRHRLDLVVRDVDRRHAEVALEAGDLGAHLHAQLRVEVRERLVHQERRRLAHDRAAHRDPLALAARERARLALQERLEAEDPRRVARRAASISAFGTFLILRPKAMLS